MKKRGEEKPARLLWRIVLSSMRPFLFYTQESHCAGVVGLKIGGRGVVELPYIGGYVSIKEVKYLCRFLFFIFYIFIPVFFIFVIQVFASGAVFDIPEDLLREYRRPAIVPLREIRRSPTKKRVSVQGVVSQVLTVVYLFLGF